MRLLYSRTSLPVDNPPITSQIKFSSAIKMGNNTRSIATISDDHLEMLTRLRVRAASRAEARERIFAEASIILATLHNITNEPHPHQLQVVTLLHTMEQRMQDLIEEMGELALEEEHDTHIVTAIWGETGEWREH